MYLEPVIEALDQLVVRPTLGNWMRYYSAHIWERIGFAYNGKRFSINETTITENLVFDFWQLAKHSNFPVGIYKSKDEQANGSDLEILLETSQGFICIAAQAKMLKGCKYARIGHKVNSHYQIDMLLEYAKRKNAIPVYLFYNRSYEPGTIKIIESLTGESIEHYGCSIGSAFTIKQYFFSQAAGPKIIPSFGDVHPDLAMPFHYLAYPFNIWYPDIHNQVLANKVRFYSSDEISEDGEWSDIAPPAKIGYIYQKDDDVVLPLSVKKPVPEFNPKYRIIVSFERKKTALYRIG
jgi:hypothetical protein